MLSLVSRRRALESGRRAVGRVRKSNDKLHIIAYDKKKGL
jgi:hypothetical protein